MAASPKGALGVSKWLQLVPIVVRKSRILTTNPAIVQGRPVFSTPVGG